MTRKRDRHWLLPLVSRHRPHRSVRYFALSFLFPYRVFLIVNGEEKRDFCRRKQRTSCRYKGKRKRRSIVTTTANAGTTGTVRPNGAGPSSVASAALPGGADFISEDIGFISASEKKSAAFQGEETASHGSGAVICEVGALTDLEWHRVRDVREVRTRRS